MNKFALAALRHFFYTAAKKCQIVLRMIWQLAFRVGKYQNQPMTLKSMPGICISLMRALASLSAIRGIFIKQLTQARLGKNWNQEQPCIYTLYALLMRMWVLYQVRQRVNAWMQIATKEVCYWKPQMVETPGRRHTSLNTSEYCHWSFSIPWMELQSFINQIFQIQGMSMLQQHQTEVQIFIWRWGF